MKERKGKKPGLNKEMQGDKQKGRWESMYGRYVQKKDNMKYNAIGQEEKTMENSRGNRSTKKFTENHFSKRKWRMNQEKCELNGENIELKLRERQTRTKAHNQD